MSADNEKLNISDIYVSIQGEGRYLGHPAIFVRTSGCNLRCQWNETICDTPYTSWYPENSWISIDEVVKKIRKLRTEYAAIDTVIVTGGEPLIQKNLDVLLKELVPMGLFVSLETNGTIARPLNLDFVSISPKLKSSVPKESRHEGSHTIMRYNREALRYWLNNYRYQLKFVINHENDEYEISHMLSDLGVSDLEHIYIMPQGVTRAELRHNYRKCIDISIRRGWNYTPRAHIEIFGNVRGT